jgi:hypothetical protein
LSTISVVVLSVVAAILSLLMLGSIGVLIWLLVRQYRLFLAFDQANTALQSTIAKMLTDHSSTLQLISQSISNTLDNHRSKVDAQISKIRGEEISVAVKQFIEIVPKQAKIATRVENACLLFIDALKSISTDFEISGSAIDRARQSGLAPEDYAPEDKESGQPFFSRSRTAAGDAIAINREAAENSGSGSEGNSSGILASFDDLSD